MSLAQGSCAVATSSWEDLSNNINNFVNVNKHGCLGESQFQ